MSGGGTDGVSRALVILSIGLATLLATAGELGLANRDTGVGRLHEIRLARPILGLVDSTWPGALTPLTELLHRPHDLAEKRKRSIFTAWTAVVHLAGFAVAAIVLSPLVRLMARPLPDLGSMGLPIALGALALAIPLRLVFVTTPAFLVLILSGALTTGVGLIVAGLMRRLDWPAAGSLGRTAISTYATLLIGVCLASVIGGGALAALTRPEPARPDLPNILLVSIDSLRSDHLGSYGYSRPTSPNLDALAAEGVRFTTAFAPCPWTLPSHMTLLTAPPPEIHRVVHGDRRLTTGAVSLPELLHDAGYATWGVVSPHFLRAPYGYSRGFDLYDDTTLAAAGAELSHRMVSSPTVVALAGELLDDWHDHGRRRPFFLFLHLWDVHYDYNPPPPHDTLFDPDYQGPYTAAAYREDIEADAPEPMSDRDRDHVLALYDGEIRFTDMWLGRLFERLRSLGVLDETIVAVTADHGEEFFEHGRKGHGKALFEESVRVPLILRYPPGLPAGAVVNEMARLMDVAPTLLSLAGLDPPAEFGAPARDLPRSARDLRPVITGDAPAGYAPVFLELYRDSRAVRTPRLKLVAPWDGQGPGSLFDLVTDPCERSNLAGRGLADEHSLRRALAGWKAAALEQELAPRQFELSEEQRRVLRSLGYAE